ncbi:MAG: S1 RNA-binding domain-containing protein [Roseiflexaceae bacterium]|nr:S1 RNA-binding domain-containing protein [Roseiflexaceae bacterium]
MTSQERPVEEQNELQQNDNGAVAVAELPAQQTQEEAAEAAEQVATSSTADAERTESAAGQREATTDDQAVERAVGEPVQPADEEPTAESVTEQPPAEQPESLAATEQPEAEQAAAQPEAVVAIEQPEAEQSTRSADDAVTSEDADAAISSAPAAESTTPNDGDAATSEEASFTPVAETESGKPRRVKDLQAGMELEGRVTSIALYGIFVDIGVGRDGLVHISEMSNTRIDSPSDIVQIGNTVKVRVKSVEPDGRRISLTMRTADAPRSRGRRKPELDRDRLGSLQVGDAVDGTVTGIAPFGIFVDIGVGKDGLVHISELSEGRIDKAEDAVTVGQSYTFKILEVDAEGTRISLSLRRAQRAQRLQGLDKGQILEGTISGIAPFGAFVDIGVGRDGLVHISELSAERVGKVEDVVTVGDKVQVRVLEMEAGSKRISLSMVLEERPQDEQGPVDNQERSDRPDRNDRPDRGDRPRREFPTLQDRQERQERVRNDRPRRDDRQPIGSTTEVYATTNDEPEENAPANATLEDLLSKFGAGNRRVDKKRRVDEVEEEETDENGRFVRNQRDAIRRTIQTMGDDE